MSGKPVATGDPPRDGADARSNKLMLEAWRREFDAWAKRVERAGGIAGGLLTTCLTAGVVGAAAAGYVQENAPARLGFVMLGIAVLIVAGTLVVGERERVEVMRRRHRFLGRLLFTSLLAFAIAVSLIAWAAYAALEAA